MKKVFLLGEDINLLSSFEAKFSLKRYDVFKSFFSDDIKNISLNILSNKIKLVIFFLNNDKGSDFLKILKKIKESLDSKVTFFIIGEDIKNKNELLELLNVDYYFDLTRNREDEIIEKIIKIEKNTYER